MTSFWGCRVRVTAVAASLAALASFGDAARRARISASISVKAPPPAASTSTSSVDRVVDVALACTVEPGDDVVTRIVVVRSLLRTALGTATLPPNSVGISPALFLTPFVMGPVLTRVLRRRVQAGVANEIIERSIRARLRTPARVHGEKCREKDLRLFMDVSGEKAPQKPEDLSMRILTP